MKSAILILCTLVLTACGGGGGGASTGSTPSGSTSPSQLPLALTQVQNQNIATNTVYNNAVGDLNGDGLDDVVVGGWNYNNIGAASLNSAHLYIFTQNTDHTLSQSYSVSYGGSQHVFIADFNNDGKPDILLPGFTDGGTEYYQPTIILWNNTPNGGALSFTQTQVTANATLAHGACIGDLNGDGYMDFLAAGFDGTNNQFGSIVNTEGGVYINNGDKTFTHRTDLNFTFFSACAIAKNGSYSNILLSDGTITTLYADPGHNLSQVSSIASLKVSASNAIDAVAVDINQDGIIDLVGLYDNTPNAAEVYLGNGNNMFSYSQTLDTLGNDYYSYVFGNGTKLFLAGTALNGVSQNRVYNLSTNGASVYSPATNFVTMANGQNSASSGAVYTSGSRIFMLQLMSNNFYTQEML